MTVAQAPLQLARADIGERERELVLEVLDSNILALGPMTRRFEEAFAAFCGTRHAVAVSSGTTGLHLATRLAGVGPGDEVITSPISFVASANAVLYQGATPVFADVDERTFNIDPGRRRGAHHSAHAGHPARPHLRLPLRPRAASGDRRPARARDRRGRVRGPRGRAQRQAPGRLRQSRGLRVLPEQADDDGRGRHGHDRRRRARRAGARARQPGPLRRGRLARARPPRLQLPHGRALGRRRARPDRAAARAARATARRSRRATASCSRTCRASSCRAPTPTPTCARGSST